MTWARRSPAGRRLRASRSCPVTKERARHPDTQLGHPRPCQTLWETPAPAGLCGKPPPLPDSVGNLRPCRTLWETPAPARLCVTRHVPGTCGLSHRISWAGPGYVTATNRPQTPVALRVKAYPGTCSGSVGDRGPARPQGPREGAHGPVGGGCCTCLVDKPPPPRRRPGTSGGLHAPGDAPHRGFPSDAISTCAHVLDPRSYSHGNGSPAKRDIWVLSHCFGPSRPPSRERRKTFE